MFSQFHLITTVILGSISETNSEVFFEKRPGYDPMETSDKMPAATKTPPIQNVNNHMLIWRKEIKVSLRKGFLHSFVFRQINKKKYFSHIRVRGKRENIKRMISFKIFLSFSCSP